MKLHERGRIRLDEPISAYLPETLIGGLHRMDGVDRTAEITVRNLLGHTSGLPDCLEERPEGGRSLIERVVREGDMAWTIEDLMGIVRSLTPHFPPQPADARRRRARYSDTNYQLLIAILETMTNGPLHAAFDDLVMRPLGLRRTYLPGREPADPTPEPATLWFEDRPLEIPLALHSFGDLCATAEDALVFMRALVTGRLFDDPATLAEMQRRWIRFGIPRDRAALRSPAWPIEYGLGAMRFRFRLPRVRTPSGEAPSLIGHTGSTGTWLFHCPQLDVVLSGTVDQATAGAVPFRFVPRVLRVLGTAHS
jgi:CubicO group peptidase (beta-lactamase class C family)